MAGSFGRQAVRGLTQARAAFRRVQPVMQKHLNKATSLTATRMEQAAGRRVQVRHGFLAEQIGSSFSRKTGVAKVGIKRGGSFTTPGGRRAVPSRYAHLVEFGTSHSRAFPFMLNSAEEQRDPYLQRVRQAGTAAEAEMARALVRV